MAVRGERVGWGRGRDKCNTRAISLPINHVYREGVVVLREQGYVGRGSQPVRRALL